MWSNIRGYKGRKLISTYYTQCFPYQAVTGKIYSLKQHFLPPANT